MARGRTAPWVQRQALSDAGPCASAGHRNVSNQAHPGRAGRQGGGPHHTLRLRRDSPERSLRPEIAMKTSSTTIFAAVCALATGFDLPVAAQTLYSDNFDLDSSLDWAVSSSSKDTSTIFFWDYSALGIPSAPHSVGGTTRGLRFAVNMADAAAAGISASPLGQSFSGDYTLSFDLWINANGPFPGGGTGSTEFFTAGVSVPGNVVQWANSASPSARWFTKDKENGSARD